MKNKKKSRKLRQYENDQLLAAGIVSSGSMSSGLGRVWKERKMMKGKDKTSSLPASGGLPSLGKKA